MMNIREAAAMVIERVGGTPWEAEVVKSAKLLASENPAFRAALGTTTYGGLLRAIADEWAARGNGMMSY